MCTRGVCAGSVLMSICRYVNVCKFFTSVVLHLAVFAVYHSSLPLRILNPTHPLLCSEQLPLLRLYLHTTHHHFQEPLASTNSYDLVHEVNDLLQLYRFCHS